MATELWHTVNYIFLHSWRKGSEKIYARNRGDGRNGKTIAGKIPPLCRQEKFQWRRNIVRVFDGFLSLQDLWCTVRFTMPAHYQHRISPFTFISSGKPSLSPFSCSPRAIVRVWLPKMTMSWTKKPIPSSLPAIYPQGPEWRRSKPAKQNYKIETWIKHTQNDNIKRSRWAIPRLCLYFLFRRAERQINA